MYATLWKLDRYTNEHDNGGLPAGSHGGIANKVGDMTIPIFVMREWHIPAIYDYLGSGRPIALEPGKLQSCSVRQSQACFVWYQTAHCPFNEDERL